MATETIEAAPRDRYRPLTDAELWRRVRVAEAESEAGRLAQEQRSGRREEAQPVAITTPEPERISLPAIMGSRSPWDAVRIAELPSGNAAETRYAVKGGGVVTVEPNVHSFDAVAERNPNAMLASLMVSKRDWGVAHVRGDIQFQNDMMELGRLVAIRVVPSPDFQTRAYNQAPQLAERSAAMLAAVKAKTLTLG